MTENPLEQQAPTPAGSDQRPSASAAGSLPSSVRQAPDLSGSGAHAPAGAPGASGAAGAPTYRRDITTAAEFQEIAQLSGQGPVVFALYRASDPSTVQAVQELQQIIDTAEGRLLLAAVDSEAAPEIAEMFQAQSALTVVALLGGRPAPLYDAPLPAEQVQQLLGQVLQLAQQNGLAGTFEPAGDAAAEPAPLPELVQKAQDALMEGDYQAARSHYQAHLKEHPADSDAKIGLAQVGLLERVKDADLQEARAAAAEHPEDLQAQMLVADLDLSGGHVEDAFQRLLGLVQRTAGEERDTVRQRLLELFEVVGHEDPRVVSARGALMRTLF